MLRTNIHAEAAERQMHWGDARIEKTAPSGVAYAVS